NIVETWVMPWAHAGAFAAPGRWRAQEMLERGLGGRVFLAGDWVSDFVSMETAALTAIDAAANVRGVIERGGVHQPPARPVVVPRDPKATKRVQAFFGDASSAEE
ncbi:MAG: hypothetical protein WCO40_06185, partial [Thermoleophilia bacterium]